MPLNLGYIELVNGSNTVVARIYYDASAPSPQPLVNGPRNWCLDFTNVSGRPSKVIITNAATGKGATFDIGKGDPVNSGATGGRSKAKNQMAALGFNDRLDIGVVEGPS